MSSTDPIFTELVFAADAEPSDGGKTAWPEYPREKATPAEIDLYIKTMTSTFNAVGLGALIRGDEPTDVKRLVQRSRSRMPADADAATRRAVDLRNEEIEHANAQLKIEKDSRMLEYKTRIAAKIELSLEKKAPLLLKRLKNEHPCKDSSGVKIDKAYDGVPTARAHTIARADSALRW